QRSRRRRRRSCASGDCERGRRCINAVGDSHRGAADRAEPVMGGCRRRGKKIRECSDQILNSKSEIRNKFKCSKTKNSKWHVLDLNFGFSAFSLFRISIFGFWL